MGRLRVGRIATGIWLSLLAAAVMACSGGGGAVARPTADVDRQGAATSVSPSATAVTRTSTAGPDTRTNGQDTPALAGGSESASIEELAAKARDPDWSKRWDAVNTLGTLGDPRAVPILVERALKDDNPHPRWRSLWALAAVDRGGENSFPLLLDGLDDADPVVGRNAAVALAFFGRGEALSELVRGLNDPDPFRRWEAVFSLRELPGEISTAAILPLLDAAREPDAGVRGEAALVLSRIGGNQVVPDLLRVLKADPDKSVRSRTALGLSLLVDSSHVSELEKALAAEQDPQVQTSIQDALKQARRSR